MHAKYGKEPMLHPASAQFFTISAQINRDSHHINKDKQGLLVRRKIL